MQNIVTPTVEISLDNVEEKFADLSGNQLSGDQFNCLIGLKITLVKFT